LAVVVAGLVLSVATALLTVSEDEGGARIEWERSAEIADTEAGRLGRDGSLRITDARIDATRENASGFSLFRVAGVLALDLGELDGRSEARCTVAVPERAVLARTPGKRAAYPLPSEDLRSQAVPELAVIRFNAKGTDIVGVEVEDAFEEFTEASSVKVEWAPYRPGEQTWQWVLEPADRNKPLTLAFMTMWRTTETPGAQIACSVASGEGRARVSADGELG
jgi:hypothetical protein